MADTDGELVKATLEGDPQAFEEIIERYKRLVFNIIYHYLGYDDEVEDLSQEVFLKVFRALETFDTQRPLKSWVARIAANTCLDHMRRARSRRVFLFSDLDQQDERRLEYYFEQFSQGNALTEGEQKELFELLEKSLQKLSEKDKMAFVLREMEGLTYSEIGQAMGTSELAVRIRVSRSKQKLHQTLGEALSQKGKTRR